LQNDRNIVSEVVKENQNNFVRIGKEFREKYPTVEAFLNSEKDISKDNSWSKGNDLDSSKAWTDKVNNDKSNDFER